MPDGAPLSHAPGSPSRADSRGPALPAEHPDWWLFAGLSLAGVALTLAHRLNADEGQILTGAWNLYNGREIYRDFFEFIGPASFEWVHLFFQLFGARYFSALVASWVLLVAGLWAFVACLRRLTDSRVVHLIASMCWLFVVTTPPFINHNAYSSHLAVLFAYVLLRFLEQRSVPRAAAAGILAAGTFFVLQPKGVVLLLVGFAIVLWSLHTSDRPSTRGGILAGAYLGGAAVPLLGGAALWGSGPVASLLTVAAGNVEMNHRTMTYLPLAGSLGLLALVAWGSWLAGRLDRRVGFLAILQLALWVSTAHLPDPYHLAINAFPLLLIVGRVGPGVLGRWSRRSQIAITAGMVALAGVAASQIVARNIAETRIAHYWIAEMERRLDGREFFAFTFLPSFYLELGVENPYYNSVLFEQGHPAEHFRRNVQVLREHRPPFVIADYSTVERFGHTGDNAVDEFLRTNYTQVETWPHSFGVIEIWQRRGSRP